jgi:diguanylate cyclase (GGDEF)-like protein/PAS domain S-box-containing protein
MKFTNILSYIVNFFNFIKKHSPGGLNYDEKDLSFLDQLNLKVTYKQLFENYPEGIAMLDNSHQVINVNQEFVNLFGYTLEELKGRNLNDFIVPDLLCDEMPDLPYSFLTENAPNNEFIRKKKDGSLIYVSILAFPMIINNKQMGYYTIYKDITDRKRIEEKLIHLGIYDALTGLYNRAFFEEQMKNYDLRIAEAGIIVCDLNGLKIINDSFGHQVGDDLLIAAASVLKKSLRNTDIVARIGGDEFAILLPYARKLEMEIICQRIRMEIALYNESKPITPLSMSLGYALAQDTITTTMSDLFKEADKNMYQEKIRTRRQTREAIINSFLSALETKDFIKDDHLEHLKEMVQNMGKIMSLSNETMEKLHLLVKYHDIGKIGISDEILFKKTVLNSREMKEIQWHSELGSRIAQSTADFIPISDLILKHHEKWDGSGYPLGLVGENIPLECRIFSLVDAYDAMVSPRPYRKPMTPAKAINEIKKCAGTHFDPHLIDSFLDALKLNSF